MGSRAGVIYIYIYIYICIYIIPTESNLVLCRAVLCCPALRSAALRTPASLARTLQEFATFQGAFARCFQIVMEREYTWTEFTEEDSTNRELYTIDLNNKYQFNTYFNMVLYLEYLI